MRSILRSWPLLLLLLAAPALAQSPAPRAPAGTRGPGEHSARPHVSAAARTGTINLDGVLAEAAWASAPRAGSFVQSDPKEGEAATQQTEVHFIYDDDALYIGARMFDDKGAAGVHTRLSRRDHVESGDFLQFVFDTYHDHSGRTMFLVNPSGVKQDAGQASPYLDSSWDPVWDVATRIDAQGWTAEFRIPWAQLRFPKDSVQTWGVQIWRYVERLNEMSMWSFWKKNETGGPQNFGHLDALYVSQKRGGLELMPYVVAKAAYQQSPQPGSPFHDDNEYG